MMKSAQDLYTMTDQAIPSSATFSLSLSLSGLRPGEGPYRRGPACMVEIGRLYRCLARGPTDQGGPPSACLPVSDTVQR